MEQAEIKPVIESLLFATGKPLQVKEMQSVFSDGTTAGVIREAIDALEKEYEEQGRAFQIQEIAGGFQIRTKASFGEWVTKLDQKQPPRLSVPALETLSIVAYRQPVTRAELEEIRGVDSGGVLKGLVERRLVKILGKKDEPGRPIIYATTPEFLGLFALKDLTDLPSLKDFAENNAEAAAGTTETDTALNFDDLMEDTAESALKMADLDEDAKETLELLDEGLKQLKDIEKGLDFGDKKDDEEEAVDNGEAESIKPNS